MVIFVLAVAGAGLLYWMKTRYPAPTLEELIPGSSAARARQVGIVIGTFGATLLDGWAYLERPGTEAILIVAVAALAALLCFRVATLLERYSNDA